MYSQQWIQKYKDEIGEKWEKSEKNEKEMFFFFQVQTSRWTWGREKEGDEESEDERVGTEKKGKK